MNNEQLEHIRTRLQSIIKESRDLIKIIDGELRGPVETKQPTDEIHEELVVMANSHYAYQDIDSANFIDALFKRGDIDIYMVGLRGGNFENNLYSFNLVKDSVITPIHILVPAMSHISKRFANMMRDRFPPKTARHLKALLNKQMQGTVKLVVYYPPRADYFVVNVGESLHTYTSHRHRNVTYLFDVSRCIELDSTYQSALNYCNGTI